MDNLRAGVTPPSDWDALRRELAEARAELSAARRDQAAATDVLRIVSGDRMRRRAFLAGLGAACACAPMARAQERPVIGVLHAGSAAENVKRVAAFREGLKQSRFVEGRDLRARIVAQVTQLRLPSQFDVPEYVEDGGLASYGNDFIDAIRQSGVYAGRILKGEKPQDLPVVQPETFVLAVNLKTASTLGLEIPPDVLAAANEVIE